MARRHRWPGRAGARPAHAMFGLLGVVVGTLRRVRAVPGLGATAAVMPAEQRNSSGPFLPKSQPRKAYRFSTVPDLDRRYAFLATESVRCGKMACRCRRGSKHGPYLWLRYQHWDG